MHTVMRKSLDKGSPELGTNNRPGVGGYVEKYASKAETGQRMSPV